ncbi:UNVERIFIED_CONTAM: hypothetical protein Sangu_1681100 [Sesamum angustifolium]|uniref:PGG domain-containing protein n=1 Tax=Sesamum angustifolium TaxID=2727405 RepID=A0AAW2MLI3_9LAMI
MEAQLFEAACSGNLQALSDIVRQSGVAFLLRLHLSGSVGTPHYLASMLGQTEFVREYMMLSSISAYQLSQLNQDDCSPLHLASATGHLEIVTFLLEFGKQKFAVEELCMKKDGDGRTALHSVVINSNINVIDVLFVHCPQAAMETVEYLVKQPYLNVNAENSHGLRALDIMFAFVFNPKDMYIEEVIRLAEGCGSQSATTTNQIRPSHDTSDTSLGSRRQSKDWLKEIRSGILIMTSVFATITFPVALTPPRGVWQDWGSNAMWSNSSAGPTHQPGVPILFYLDLTTTKDGGIFQDSATTKVAPHGISVNRVSDDQVAHEFTFLVGSHSLSLGDSLCLVYLQYYPIFPTSSPGTPTIPRYAKFIK